MLRDLAITRDACDAAMCNISSKGVRICGGEVSYWVQRRSLLSAVMRNLLQLGRLSSLVSTAQETFVL